MNRIRAFYDADRTDWAVPTTYKTEENKNELLCSECGATAFVDDLVFKDVNEMTKKSLENPFLCGECVEQYEDAAHGG